MMSWDKAVADHATIVLRVAQRILGMGPDAEDIAQEVFLEAFQLRQKEEVHNWGGLLRVMATRRALNRLRDRRRTEPLSHVELPSGDSGPYENAVAGELAERLREAVAELPDGQATVFSLRYFENLSYEQIAEVLHIEVIAVGSALYKARAKLQMLLKIGIGGAKS
jgi:RNA polymerase sigma-70 factor (ECF subfamily)